MAIRLKIGLFSYAFPYPQAGFNPGIENVIYNLALRLSQKARVTVYTSAANGNKKAWEFEGIRILSSGGLKIPFFSLNMFVQAANTLKYYRDEILKEDILHDMGSFMSFWFKSINKPSIATFHHYEPAYSLKGHLAGLPLRVLAGKYSSADGIITPSEFSKQQFLFKFGARNFSKIYVIPHGVDHNIYNTSVAPKSNLKNIIIFLGVLSARKGPVYLIRAIPLIKKELPDVKAIIIGKGHQEDFLIKEAIKLGVKENIEFLGFLRQEEIPGYYRCARCTVLPSLIEGFGITALESMAEATPVIASGIEPLVSLIGKAGLYFPCKNHIVLARQIIRILKDDNLRKNLSKEAQNRAKQYSWEKTAHAHLEVYEQVLSGKRIS